MIDFHGVLLAISSFRGDILRAGLVRFMFADDNLLDVHDMLDASIYSD